MEEDNKTTALYKANNKSVKNSEAIPQENNANELPYSDQIYVDYDDDSKVLTKNYRKVSDILKKNKNVANPDLMFSVCGRTCNCS